MSGRNQRFVRTAKRLLLLQVAAGALAVGLAGWAALEVSGVVRERDALAARVAELEARRPVIAGAYPEQDLPPAPPATEATPAVEPQPVDSPVLAPPTPPPPPSPPPAPPPAPPPSPPPGPPPAPPPSPPPAPPPPAPPQPARDCQSVERRAIVCVPPFRRTPVPGVCVDGNNRPMRCPPGTLRPQESARDPNREQQQPATMRR